MQACDLASSERQLWSSTWIFSSVWWRLATWGSCMWQTAKVCHEWILCIALFYIVTMQQCPVRRLAVLAMTNNLDFSYYSHKAFELTVAVSCWNECSYFTCDRPIAAFIVALSPQTLITLHCFTLIFISKVEDAQWSTYLCKANDV